MWKTGWKLLLILILVAFFISLRGKETAAKKDAELVWSMQSMAPYRFCGHYEGNGGNK